MPRPISYAVFCLKKKRHGRHASAARGGAAGPRGCGGFCRSSLFFTVPATTEIYTLSLHDALPISTKIRVNATCRKCPHKVHRMEMKTAISCTILRHTKILIAVGV